MNQLINVLLLGQDVSETAEAVESFQNEMHLLSTTAVDSLNSLKKSLQQEKIDLVITDVHLDWLDIQQVLLMMRQTWPTSTIILYTAERDARLIAPCFKLGVAHYIAKPDITKLKEAVQEALAIQQRSQRPPYMARRERLLEALGNLAQQFYAKIETGTVWELLPALCAQFDVSRVRLLENKTKPDKHSQDSAYKLQAKLFYEWVVPRKKQEPHSSSEPFCYADEGLSRWVKHLSAGEVLTSMVESLPTAEANFIKRTLPGTQMLALIPVFSGERWWGILELTEERPTYIWSQGEIEAFMSTASILGAAVEIQRLVQAEQKQRHNAENLSTTLQRQASELRELFAMAISLSQTLEPAVLVHKLYEHINTLFAPDIFIATLYDAEADMVEIALALEEGQPMGNIPKGLRLSLEEAGVTGWIIRHKQTIFIDDMTVKAPPVALRRISERSPRTWLGTPLIVGQKTVGVISLQSRQPYAFDQNNRRVVETLATFVGLAVDNSRLFQQETRRRLGAEALVSLATAIIQDNEQSKILDSVVAAVMAFLPDISNCRVSLFNEEMTHVHVLRSKGQDDEASILLHKLLGQAPISLDKATMTRRALEKDAPLAIYDLRQEEGLSEHSLQAVTLGVQSLLLVPMRVHGRVVGMLEISVNHHSRHFTKSEINLCQSIANYGAVALQNARLREAEQSQLNLAKTLRQVGSLLTSEHALDEVYEQLFDLLDKVIDYEKVTIQLYDAPQERLFLAAMRGFDDWSEVERVVDELGFEYVSHIMNSRQPYRVVADTQADPSWVPVPKFTMIRSSINCLLRIKDRVIGILNVDHIIPNAYTAESARIVLAFANQAAIALENARLYDELSQRINELSIINQVTMVSTTSLYLDELLAQTTAVLAKERFPHYVGFYLLDEIGRFYVPHPSFHTAVGLPPPPRLSLEETAFSFNTNQKQGLFTHEAHPYLQPFLTILISVPMQINEKTIGLMTVGFADDSEEVLNTDNFYFLQTVAGQLSTAVQRASLYEDAQLYAAQLSDRILQRTGEVQAEKDRTQAILDTAGEGIFFTDPAGKILYANEAVATQSGYLVNEIIGQPIYDFYHATPTTSDKTITTLRKHISANREWRGEIDNFHRDGTPYTVSANVTPLADSLGTQSGFVIVQADITHLKEVERLKTEFVSNVSHELRTPLTNIKTYLTLLRRGKREKAAHYLDVLDHETERLARLIQDLLNLSRLDTESTVMTLQPVLLTAVVEDILPALYTQASQHTLTWLPPSTNLHILADTEHLQQAIIRLVYNAIAYTPSGGKITLTAGQDDNAPYMVYLHINDNGPGLTAEDKEHIFERFFRGTAALETRQPGTGLGLAISQEIITRHRGHIEAHNNPDQGVTFTIWLPKSNEE